MKLWIAALAACIALAAGLPGCEHCAPTTQPPPALPVCRARVEVSVTAGTTPTFSWTPDCLIGRLIVEAGPGEEYWGTETLGSNIYRSPIVYGVHPPGASEQQIAEPLTPGVTYTVYMSYWTSTDPDSLDAGGHLVGQLEFTP